MEKILEFVETELDHIATILKLFIEGIAVFLEIAKHQSENEYNFSN